MLQTQSINLGNLLLSLSDALDLAAPSLTSYQQRTAYMCMEVGRTMGLAAQQAEQLFVAALLHDIGALTPEEKVALHNNEVMDPTPHCKRGESLFASVSWFRPSAGIVRHHHTPWQSWNEPLTQPVVLLSQVLSLADIAERAIDRHGFILHQDDVLRNMVKGLAGVQVNSDVVDAFLSVSNREEFWLDIVSPRLYSLLLHNGPYREFMIDIEGLSSLAGLFRDIIDFRSRFTATHSSGVAECASTMARLFGMSQNETLMMEVAGNLHDLGKLSVPNSILEKPAGLTQSEFAVIRQHTYWTYAVLNTIGGLDLIAEWAAFHHERLDGRGYPFHLNGDRLSSGARIMMVADIFTALAEDRPYRSGMPKDRAMPILVSQGERGILDRRLIQLLADNYDEVERSTKEKQAATRAFYESHMVVAGCTTEK